MAKKEYRLRGGHDDFSRLLSTIESGILRGSVSASYEDGSDWWNSAGVRCAVRVYERYSVVGSNRVSLSVTVIGTGEELFVSAITSGGSQAMFFKLNTLGEEAFLGELDRVIRDFRNGGG